ncbi:MAG: efflux transporter outer membrane subunit [Gemmatimonadales bacterium]|nr:efflux transporter outer membrane subunit [Gemmatimonadales bacterium]
MMIRALLGCSVILLLSGCATGPNYVRPELGADVPEQWSAQTAAAPDQASSLGDALSSESGSSDGSWRWWEAFGDPNLNDLVVEALAHNHDLDAATSRVLEAQAMLGGSKSALYPALDLGAAAARSKASSDLTSPLFSPYNNNFSVTGTVRWEADLWGKLRRGKEASTATLLASEQDRRAFAQILIANVTLTWLQVKELQLQVDLNERTVANLTEHLATVSDRYQRGLVSALDLRLVRQNLASTQAAGPSLRQELVAARRRLEILAGRYPTGSILSGLGQDESSHLISLAHRLGPVPTGLPGELLERRPDLLAAEARLHAATAGIGQAKAALYPRISLTAEGGSKTNELANLFTSPTEAWSLVSNLFMPILNRGATQAQIKAAEARAKQTVASYRSSVLQAFAEVENALDQDRHLALQENFLVDSVEQARNSLVLAEDRYARGLDNLLITLDTQRRLYSAESQFLSVQRSRCAARVSLILALGGPWSDVTNETQTASTETIPHSDSNEGADK